MRRLAVIPVILLFLSIIVPARSNLLPVNSCSPVQNQNSQNQPAKSKYQYEFLSTARAQMKNGSPGVSRTYESSDGVKIWVSYEYFDSPAAVKAAVKKRSNHSIKIIERGPIKDEAGKEKGERILSIEAKGKTGVRTYDATWASDTIIAVISSKSLEHTLDFENWSFKAKK